MELNGVNNREDHSNEKLEGSQHLDRRIKSRIFGRRDKYRLDKKVIKENVQGETEETLMKENCLNIKEVNNKNVDFKPDSIDFDSEGWQKVLPRRKQSKKRINMSKQACKTDNIGNKFLSQNEHDRFNDSEQYRNYPDNLHQQKNFLDNFPNKKAVTSDALKKKYSNRSAKRNYNLQNSRDLSTTKNLNLYTNSNEESIENYVSIPNEELSTSTVKNLKESVEDFSTKHFGAENPTECQLKSKGELPKALPDQQDETICSNIEETNALSNQNIVDELELKKNDCTSKPTQHNSQDEIASKEIDCDVIKSESIKQTQLNVYAEEFSPINKFNNDTYMGKPKEQRKEIVIPSLINVENLDEDQHNIERSNSTNMEEITACISTSCETDYNSASESVPQIPENVCIQNMAFESQNYESSEIPNLIYNEALLWNTNESGNRFLHCRNLERNEHYREFNNLPEHLTNTNQNYGNGSSKSNAFCCYWRDNSWVCGIDYKGTIYFFTYPDVPIEYSRLNRISDRRYQVKCPRCSDIIYMINEEL